MAILSTTELNSIISDIRTIIEDDTISTSITYHLSGSTVADWDPTDGVIPAMYAASAVSSFKSSYSLEEVELSGGEIQLGDLKFILMLSAVSGILSTEDRIVEASQDGYQSATTYELVAITRDPLDIAYFLQCRTI